MDRIENSPLYKLLQQIFGDRPRWKFTIDTSKSLIKKGVPSSAASLTEKDEDGIERPVFTTFDVIDHWRIVDNVKCPENIRRKARIEVTFEDESGWKLRLIATDGKCTSISCVSPDLRDAIIHLADHVKFLTGE